MSAPSRDLDGRRDLCIRGGSGQPGAALRYCAGGILSTLLVFVLRLWALNATSIWYDEAFMLTHVREGIVPGVIGLFQEDNALPLHGLILAIWVQLAGDGEFAARYLSVLLGTLGAPLVLRLSQALAGKHHRYAGTHHRYAGEQLRGAGGLYKIAPLRDKAMTGIGSVIAYATLPILVYYSQEVRMYALAIPLATAFAWTGWRLATKGRGALAYVGLGVLMLAAHLYTALTWAAIGLWGTLTSALEIGGRGDDVALDVAPTRGSHRWHVPNPLWWRANVALGLLAVPIVAWAVWRLQMDATAVSSIPLGTLRWIPILFGVGQYLPAPWPAIFVAVTCLALMAAIVMQLASGRSRSALWLLITLTLPIVLLFLLTTIKAKWNERYLLPSWGVSLVVAVGIGWESLLDLAPFTLRRLAAGRRPGLRRLLALGLSAVGILLMGAWLMLVTPALAHQAEGTWALALQDEWHPRPDFRGVARYIETHSTSRDGIVVVGGYAASTLDYYYEGPVHLFGLPYNTRILDMQRVIDLSALEILEREAGAAERLWLVLWQDHLADPTNLVQSALVEACQRLPVHRNFMNVGLLLFDVRQCRPLDQLVTPTYPLNVAFQVPMQLEGYDVILRGDLWEVDLWWRNTARLTENYTVFVHLVGPEGAIVSQHDHIAGADAYPTSAWREGTRLRDRFYLRVPEDISAAGSLRIGLYTVAGRVPLADGGDALTLDVAGLVVDTTAP
ncbi:MAG: hypothetical protein JXC32_13295 [Anaerolineae bacterium]|nr:hypothetical protein [Anaerolineae bacterium]